MAGTGGTAPGLRWNWQPNIWKWLPAAGAWTPNMGGPGTGATQLDATTAEILPGERFDFWREIALYDFAPRALDPDRRRDFKGHGSAIFSWRGTMEFVRAGAMSGRAAAARSRREDPRLYIGLMLAGERRHVSADGTAGMARPGDFFTLDTTRPTGIDWTDRCVLQLSLPLHLLAAEVGTDDLPSADDIARTLSQSRLSACLRAQLKLMARHSRRLSESERGAMNDIAFDLVSAIVKTSSAGSRVEREPLNGRALVAATAHFIEKNLSSPDLDTEQIARAVGCSRATLYRAFAEQGVTVADALRRARLDRARSLIEANPRLAISDVAMRCGLPEPRTFNRLFRQFYDMTPSELRHGVGRADVDRR